MQIGKIFFVGAGPGDTGLLTVKGKQVLLNADTVIYDKSVGDEILALIPDIANKIFLGDFSKIEQNEIYRILTEAAKQGKCIVCLKGENPFLFGNGSIYAKRFANEGISVEIVPGVEYGRDSEKFSLYSQNPLSGWNIIVTRPREMGEGLARKLRWYGAKVLEVPTIHLKLLENDAIIDVILRHVWDCQWIIFTSQISVDAFFRQAKKRQMDARKFSACKFAVIGPKTKKRLAYYGIIADLMPEIYTICELGKKLAKQIHSGERVLFVREQDGDRYLLQKIRRIKKVLFEDLPLYKYVPKTISDLPDGLELENYFSSERTIFVFSGSLEVKSFVEMYKGTEIDKIKAICLGEKTQKTAVSYGMQTMSAGNEITADEVVELILDVVRR